MKTIFIVRVGKLWSVPLFTLIIVTVFTLIMG